MSPTTRRPRAFEPVLDPHAVELLLRAAVRAPSLHNTQPWMFAFGDRHIEVYSDSGRHLPHADAVGRSQLVSCGAAVFNLRVAAAHIGLHPRLHILPDEQDPTLIAVLETDHRHSRPTSLDHYYPAIWLRRTNRLPFRERRIPPAVIGRLAEAARLEAAVLRVYDDETEVSRVIALLRDADRRDRADPGRVAERQTWVGGHHRPEGIPIGSLGPRPVDQSAAFRDLGHAVATVRESAQFEKAPTIAMLSTSQDRTIDWVRAGQALERVLLEATLSGLSASFMNQPLEHRDLRWLVRSPLTGVGHTHMLLRLGYGEEVPLTPRRPIEQVRREPKLGR